MAEEHIGDIEGGTLVAAWVEGREFICLKAFRTGKAHVTHYLIPLDPAPHLLTELSLVYKDPDDKARSVGRKATLVLSGEAPSGGPPEVGQAFTNKNGSFLKVLDADSQLRPYAYVDLNTGEVRVRQEQGRLTFIQWEVERKGRFFGLF